MKLFHYPETDVKVCASEDKIVLAIFTGRVPLTVFVFSARILYWRKISKIVIAHFDQKSIAKRDVATMHQVRVPEKLLNTHQDSHNNNECYIVINTHVWKWFMEGRSLTRVNLDNSYLSMILL